MNDTQNEADVFLAALEIDAPEARAAYLEATCGDDDQLRQRVEALLKRHLESDGILDTPPPGLVPTSECPTIAEGPGMIVGRYRLVEQIGEGGFGVVFLAEQERPVKRRVALKIIKPGMDTRQVIARFEAERQALAMMDHPNIARVLDAGTTDTGRPYFVMDLVKGVPITDYCDQQHLPVRERLELLSAVCHAVQHAHQKGIIHRDIKPSNVLVQGTGSFFAAESPEAREATENARPAANPAKKVPVPLAHEKPLVKIIDFGVAKAIEQRLTEKTVFTELGQMIGTVEYMSPEQARFNQVDIDTRSDIYSLGVLLYELLTGSTPFARKRLNESAFDEMLRIIREEEPPKPSTRLTTSDALPSIAVNRALEPVKLNRLVEGELDWIAMKALEKDRNRRYESATSLAGDIERFLNDEPVLACPPSVGYRFRKFARRNKGLLALALLTAAGVMMAIVGLSISNLMISSERNQKVAALKSAEDNLVLALKALDEVYLQGIGQDRLLSTSSDQELPTVRERVPFTKDERQLLERGLKFYEQFAFQNASRPEVRFQVAQANRCIGDICVNLSERERARAAFKEAISYLNKLTAEAPQDPTYWELLGRAYDKLNKTEESSSARFANFQQAVHAFTKWIELQPSNSEAYIQRADVYLNLFEQGLSDEAIELAAADAHRGVELDEKNSHAHWKYARILTSEARQARHRRSVMFFPSYKSPPLSHRCPENPLAMKHAEEAVRLAPNDWHAHCELAKVLFDTGDVSRAVLSAKRSLELSENENTYFRLAETYWKMGDVVRALECARHGINVTRSPGCYFVRGQIEVKRGNYAAALANFESATRQENIAGDVQAAARMHRADLYMKLGRYEEAIEDLGVLAKFPLQRSLGMCPYLYRAVAHLQLGHKEEALHDLEAAADAGALNQMPPMDAALAAKFRDPVIQQGLRRLVKKAELSTGPSGALFPFYRLFAELGMTEDAAQVVALVAELEPRPRNAAAMNYFAWFLATSPEPQLRDINRAVELAKKAVAIAPINGSFRNTLGAALYRAGDWRAAIDAFKKSIALRDGGDSEDFFFLAMAHWQLDDKVEARRWYDQAVEWMDTNNPDNEELRRFRAEAAELLGIAEPQPSIAPQNAVDQPPNTDHPTSEPNPKL